MPRHTLATAAILAGLTLATPGAAQTSPCPTGPAFDGVYVEFEDRLVRHERLSDGVTAEFEIADDQAYLYEYRTHPVGLLLECWEFHQGRMTPDNVETVALSGGTASLPQPAAGVTWSGEETSQFSDGQVLRFRTTVEIEEAQAFSIGPCQYTGLPIVVSRVDLGNSAVTYDALVYLQELGIAVYLGGGDSRSSISYSLPVSIGARPPLPGGVAPAPRVDTK